MRRLLLARHAKSSWDDPGLSDHDRPLNDRGVRSAPLVAAELGDLGYVPDLVYSSTSARTRETWALMEPHFGGHPDVAFQSDLYLASAGEMLGLIQSAPEGAHTIMLLAHNPGTHALAVGLARRGRQDRLEQMRLKFPTGAVAVIELPGDEWRNADNGGELVDLIRPRDLIH